MDWASRLSTKIRVFIKLTCCVVWVVSPISMALPEFIPAQERAQGHSLTGANQLNDSVYTNPAASAFTNVYSVDGTFLLPRSFSVSVLDTKTSAIGGALGYFRRSMEGTNEYLQGLRLNFAGRITNYLGVGVGGKLLWGPGPEGVKSKLTDLDAGVLGTFSFLQGGIAVRNIAGGNSQMGLEREWAAGLRAGYQNTLFFSSAALATWAAIKPYQYGFGVEYVSPYYFALKGGFRFQPDARRSYWSGGLSFVSPRLSVHYAVEFPQQNQEKIEHTVGMTLLL